MWSPDPACDTIAIVGAGFCGVALAHRLLRAESWKGRVLLIERTGQFGPGLAYSALTDNALLNVPAGNMSLDEHAPDDFVQYLRQKGHDAHAHEFVPRRLYGHYLQDRLNHIAQRAAPRRQLVRVHGATTSIAAEPSGSRYAIAIDDGRRIVADRVVLATGHAKPAPLPAFSALQGTSFYVHDPWSMLPSRRPGGRVLIVGTGLTMADVVTELLDRPGAPEKIIAVSRRGFVPHERIHGVTGGPPEAPEAASIAADASLRAVLSQFRQTAREVAERGGCWREVMAAVRTRTPPLWHALPLAERRRFLRHLQPYWDVHRHMLPPPVARVLRQARESGRLEFRAARITSALADKESVTVTLRLRGSGASEALRVDQVINCTGPATSPTQDSSALVRSLSEAGVLTPDVTGCGIAVDAECRLLDRRGAAAAGLHYLGPWLRARDWEMTAVPDLRRAATALAHHLTQRAEAVHPSRAALAHA